MTKALQNLDDKHRIFQFTDGFSFGTDAVLLSGFIKTKKDQIGVEFGTGTGIIPILLSIHKEFSHIYAFEIQKDYALLAKENIEMNEFSDKISIINESFIDAKKFLPEKVDFIFANLPYMKADSGYMNLSEKKLASRHEMNGDVFDAAKAASGILQDKGEFFAVYRMDRLCDMIHALKNNDLEPKNIVFVSGRENTPPKLFLIRAVKGAKSGMKTRNIFIIEDKFGKRTAECDQLYEKGMIEW